LGDHNWLFDHLRHLHNFLLQYDAVFGVDLRDSNFDGLLDDSLNLNHSGFGLVGGDWLLDDLNCMYQLFLVLHHLNCLLDDLLDLNWHLNDQGGWFFDLD